MSTKERYQWRLYTPEDYKHVSRDDDSTMDWSLISPQKLHFSERRTKCYTRTTKNNLLRLWNFAKRQTSGSNPGNPPGWSKISLPFSLQLCYSCKTNLVLSSLQYSKLPWLLLHELKLSWHVDNSQFTIRHAAKTWCCRNNQFHLDNNQAHAWVSPTTQNLLSVAVPALGDHENWRQKCNFDSRETKVQRLTTVFQVFNEEEKKLSDNKTQRYALETNGKEAKAT